MLSSRAAVRAASAELAHNMLCCSTMYWDDRYGTETVSHEVLGRMKQLMVDNNTAASHSFLLDDDSSIPFSLDDISNLMEDKVRPLVSGQVQQCICRLRLGSIAP